MTKLKNLHKILFLDVDGVLNTHKTNLKYNNSYVPYFSDLEPSCMDNLTKILEALPDVRLVIHSAWREEMPLQMFHYMFKQLDQPVIAERIIHCTNPLVSKSQSIREYLSDYKPQNFIIVDDDTLFDLGDPLNSKQHKTSMYMGLTMRDADKIINIFEDYV